MSRIAIVSKFLLAGGAAALTLATAAQADTVITQWTFNSNPTDATTSTGTLTPNVGSGTASLVGGTTGTFAAGTVTDPASSGNDNSGWNISTWAAQGAGSGSRGMQFLVSTVGNGDVTVSFDMRDSGTVSRYMQMQYTIDGSTWLTPSATVGSASGPVTLNNNTAATFGNDGLIAITAASGSQQFAEGFSYTFNSTAGTASNSNFGFRFVAVFAPSTTNYISSNAGTTAAYSTSGTLRIDMVTITPTPGAASLVGLGTLMIGRRRRA